MAFTKEFREKQEALNDKLRKLRPWINIKDIEPIEKKVEIKKEYSQRYKNFHRGMQPWRRLWE